MAVTVIGAGIQNPISRKYLFIDGNYFQKTIQSQAKRIGIDITVPIDYTLLSAKYERVIYYDALPSQKKNQNDSDYEKDFDEKQLFLNSLRMLPKFHVRDGVTRMRPRAKDGIEQKGVDTWLAIEVLQYAFRNTIDVAEVITGDLDLYPLFEALVQTNTQGVLHYEVGHTSPELIMSADHAHPITSIELLDWADHTFASEYRPGQNEIIDDAVVSQSDIQSTKYGDCTVKFDNSTNIWQANFKNIGNVFTAKSRLVLIDQLNKFLGGIVIKDSAFLK